MTQEKLLAIISQLYKLLYSITTKGDDTLNMTKCLNALEKLYEECKEYSSIEFKKDLEEAIE